MHSNTGEVAQIESVGGQSSLANDDAVTGRRIALLISAFSLAFVFLSSVLAFYALIELGESRAFVSHQILNPIAAAIYLFLGVKIIGSQPRNEIGWLFLSVGALYSLTALTAVVNNLGTRNPVGIPTPLLDLATWLNFWVWIPTIVLPTVFVFFLFPDGRLPSSRWRPVAWIAALGLILVVFAVALYPVSLYSPTVVVNPFGINSPARVLDVLLNIGTVCLAIGMAAAILAVVVRYRRATGLERQQLKLLIYACLAVVVISILTVPLYTFQGESPWMEELGIASTTLSVIALAVAVTVAIVRFGLYNIDVLVNRALLYGVLTAAIVLIYVIIVGGASILFQSQNNWFIALLATGLIAALFNPFRAWLQRGINRLIYGQRDEPYEVLAQLGQRLEDSVSAESVYPTIVETVAQTLRLPYVALEVRQGTGYQLAESTGRPNGETAVYPLYAQNEEVGRLLVGQRSPGEKLTTADERLLRNIARQAGTAVYEVQLTDELQRSRQEIVASREEERRRLRRDLHDGLGPALASLHLETGLLRRLIVDDPEAAAALAAEMQGDIRATIEDVRRVVHELRPPALDDLGLVPALTVMASKLSRPGDDTSGLQIDVVAPDTLPALPAAVEVAAYRIVQEALTNVVRHAQAHCAVVRLRPEGDLIIEVADDGIGFGQGRPGGLGLQSMRERAAEVGGRCTIQKQSGGGTLVQATLPVTAL